MNTGPSEETPKECTEEMIPLRVQKRRQGGVGHHDQRQRQRKCPDVVHLSSSPLNCPS